MFVSGSYDEKMVVWDENGNNIETHQSESEISAIVRLRDGSIVTADCNLINIRQMLNRL